MSSNTQNTEELRQQLAQIYRDGYYTSNNPDDSSFEAHLRYFSDNYLLKSNVEKAITDSFKEQCHVTVHDELKYWKLDDPEDALDKFFPEHVKNKVLESLGLNIKEDK